MNDIDTSEYYVVRRGEYDDMKAEIERLHTEIKRLHSVVVLCPRCMEADRG